MAAFSARKRKTSMAMNMPMNNLGYVISPPWLPPSATNVLTHLHRSKDETTPSKKQKRSTPSKHTPHSHRIMSSPSTEDIHSRLDSLNDHPSSNDWVKPDRPPPVPSIYRRRTGPDVLGFESVSGYPDPKKKELVLSDTEMNDFKIVKEKVLEVYDYQKGVTSVVDYTRVSLPISKVYYGSGFRDIINKGGLRFEFTTDFETARITDDDKTLTKIAISDIDSLKFADTVIHFKIGRLLESRFKDIQLQVSKNNQEKFISIWKECLMQTKSNMMTIEKCNAVDLENLIRKGERVSKLKKDFASLKNPRMAKTKKGKVVSLPGSQSQLTTEEDDSKSENTTSNITTRAPATPPDAFYQTKLLATSRQTRSSTQKDTFEPILVDDIQPATPPRKMRQPRVPFKPALKYTFADSSVFTIRDSDYRTLESRQWVNDTLIDFFTKYFTDEKVNEGSLTRKDFHAFSTFFFTKLNSSKQHYENIKRWVSKIDLMEKDFAIIPINEALHWYCSIVTNLRGLLKEDPHEVCTVYVFDSLAQNHEKIINPIRTFIIEYMLDKHNRRISPKRFRFKVGAVPKQPNFNDCGIHVLYNIFKFLHNHDDVINIWEQEKPKRNEIRAVFKEKERDGWRGRLRAVLKDLQTEMIDRGDAPPEEEEGDDAADTKRGPDEEDDEEDLFMFTDADTFHMSKQGGKSGTATTTKNSSSSSREPSVEKTEKGDTTPSVNAEDENKVEDQLSRRRLANDAFKLISDGVGESSVKSDDLVINDTQQGPLLESSNSEDLTPSLIPDSQAARSKRNYQKLTQITPHGTQEVLKEESSPDNDVDAIGDDMNELELSASAGESPKLDEVDSGATDDDDKNANDNDNVSVEPNRLLPRERMIHLNFDNDVDDQVVSGEKDVAEGSQVEQVDMPAGDNENKDEVHIISDIEDTVEEGVRQSSTTPSNDQLGRKVSIEYIEDENPWKKIAPVTLQVEASQEDAKNEVVDIDSSGSSSSEVNPDEGESENARKQKQEKKDKMDKKSHLSQHEITNGHTTPESDNGARSPTSVPSTPRRLLKDLSSYGFHGQGPHKKKGAQGQERTTSQGSVVIDSDSDHQSASQSKRSAPVMMPKSS